MRLSCSGPDLPIAQERDYPLRVCTICLLHNQRDSQRLGLLNSYSGSAVGDELTSVGGSLKGLGRTLKYRQNEKGRKP